MARSMTGFGKSVAELDGVEISAEISSVNHRYLDCSVRVPGAWMSVEHAVKSKVKSKVSRGKVTVSIRRKRSGAGVGRLVFDAEVARQYLESAKQLSDLHGGNEEISIDTLAGLDGVFTVEESEHDMDLVSKTLTSAVGDALEQLCEMREREGQALVSDMNERVSVLREFLGRIEQRLPSLNEGYEKRLRERLASLAADTSLTEERLAIEVAVIAEKRDVTEEVVRLKAHMEHMLELLESDEPVGRQLDFLIQEMLRETNTLGVKTRDLEVCREVLGLKGELEKVREQVQNIE